MHHSEPTPSGLQIILRAGIIPFVRRLAACAALCQALGACAMPLGGLVDSEPTGSISTVAAKVSRTPDFPASLDEEDRRRALGALSIALDPQGNGATVHWDNPVSKAHGSMTPSGFAYPSKDLICRAFSARFETAAGAEAGDGSACRDKDAQWSLSEFHTAKKS
jgi:surface antigen